MAKNKKYPRVEKYIDKHGRTVHREYHLASDIPFPTKEKFEETYLNVLLKLTPKRDLEALEKHYKGSTKQPDGGKPVKTFPQYLTNYIPDDKKELFAEKVRTEFCTERNLPFRYMLEGLKELKLLNWYVHGERADFYRSIKAYFSRDIGAITGIFDKTDIDKTDIDKAIERINPIFLEVKPSK